MDGYTAFRNGLREHIHEGCFTPFDLGVYMFLHMEANWETGMYRGCASGIARGFGATGPKITREIQKSLFKLREKHYINYQRITGKRGLYLILINKYEIRSGGQKGTRLNAWKHGSSAIPEYEPRAEVGQNQGRSGAEVGHILINKEIINTINTKTTTPISTLPPAQKFKDRSYRSKQSERRDGNRQTLLASLHDAEMRDKDAGHDVKRLREGSNEDGIRLLVSSIGNKTM